MALAPRSHAQRQQQTAGPPGEIAPPLAPQPQQQPRDPGQRPGGDEAHAFAEVALGDDRDWPHLLHIVQPDRPDAWVDVGEEAVDAARIEPEVHAARDRPDRRQHADPRGPAKAAAETRQGGEPQPRRRHAGHQVQRQRVAGLDTPAPGRRLDGEQRRRAKSHAQPVGQRRPVVAAIEGGAQGQRRTHRGAERESLQADRRPQRRGPAGQQRAADARLDRARERQHGADHLHVVVVDAAGAELDVQVHVARQHHGAHDHRRVGEQAEAQPPRRHQRGQRRRHDPQQRPGEARRELRIVARQGQPEQPVEPCDSAVEQARPVHPQPHRRLEAHHRLVPPAAPVEQRPHGHQPRRVVGVAVVGGDPVPVVDAQPHRADRQHRQGQHPQPAGRSEIGRGRRQPAHRRPPPQARARPKAARFQLGVGHGFVFTGVYGGFMRGAATPAREQTRSPYAQTGPA